MTEIQPPRKRFRMELFIDAHTQVDLAHELWCLANDGSIDGFPSECTSSSGYHFTVTDLGEGHDKETFDAELRQWITERREA